MRVYFQGQPHTLLDSDLLGEGGEARVYRVGDLAFKIFHPIATNNRAAQRVRDDKLRKLRNVPPGLPAAVVTPRGLVTDKQGTTLGYAMLAVNGAHDIGRYASRRFRDGLVSNAEVARVFARVRDTVAALHQRQVVVGDLNDGNIVVRGLQPALIDFDSMQFGGLPCPVAHERFLDPRFYGRDLHARPTLDEGSDWYAFSVLLFSSLLYLHPFGGVCAKYPTLLRRAEAGHSALQPDVTWPRGAATPKGLSDDLLQFFTRVFDGRERTPIPPKLLDAPWTKCHCGLEHQRAVCPDCHALGPVSARPVLTVVGRCKVRSVLSTHGRVWAAAMQGGLRYAYEEDGVLKREDGTAVGPAPAFGSVVGLAGARTFVADAAGRVTIWSAGTVVERTGTGLCPAGPVLSAAMGHQLRLDGAWLVDHATQARLGQVLEGQTRVWTSERLTATLYRAGGVTVASLGRAAKPGLKRVELPGLPDAMKLLDASVVFDDGHALFSFSWEAGGKSEGAMYLFDATGTLLGVGRGEGELFTRVSARALLFGRVVAAGDSGLCTLSAEQGVLAVSRVFVDTQALVSTHDELLAQPDGSLVVVGTKSVAVLSLT